MCTCTHKYTSTWIQKNNMGLCHSKAIRSVANSPALGSMAHQCRTHSEANNVLLHQYRRWCATCFGRRTWWQRYGSVSPHLDLNILFVETYQIALIWYFHTRPLQSLNSEPVNISGRSQASFVFSDLHLFLFFGSSLSNGTVFQSSCPISANVAHCHPDGTLLFS